MPSNRRMDWLITPSYLSKKNYHLQVSSFNTKKKYIFMIFVKNIWEER